MTDFAQIFAYHDATKHHPHRYARSLGYLDWATQPDPFRRYAGADVIPLVLGPRPTEPTYDDLFQPAAIPMEPLTHRSLSLFLECSLAISAWKSYGNSTWALRCNPSSGNLHPTEGYLILGPTDGIADRPGVYHYAAKEHALERRCRFAVEPWRRLEAAFAPHGAPCFLVGLSSIHWREAWKYGERAFRYCQHDVGHALAALRLSATMLGWRLTLLDWFGDDDISRLLGLNREADYADAEREHPDLIAIVTAAKLSKPIPESAIVPLVEAAADGQWMGTANRLSSDHVAWDIIDTAAQATQKPRTEITQFAAALASQSSPVGLAPNHLLCDAPGPWQTAVFTARQIFLQRRSALDFDGKTPLPCPLFYRMLARLLPGDAIGGPPPWDALPWPPTIHLLLFVHRVESLPPGLYGFVRDPAKIAALRDATNPDFSWSQPPGCPDWLPLYLLTEADCRRAAAQLSLGQDIAGDSAFSLGIIGDFEASLRHYGPWFYRRLFWEAGVVGQVLYLEAEAAARITGRPFRATGIGAYFDDPVHAAFGLEGHAFQSLYHFTLGAAVDDPRLTTLPAYGPDVAARR